MMSSVVIPVIPLPFAVVGMPLDLPVFFFMAVPDRPLIMTAPVFGIFHYIVVVMAQGLGSFCTTL